MKNYFFGVLSRTYRQFWFFVGRFVCLSLLLIVVSSGIRGTGEAILGMRYYYLVMPGVACHESGHALGCLLTGHEIVEFAPFKPHGDVLGYVRWSPGEITFATLVAAFFIGTGPLWFGCLVVWLLSLPLLRANILSAFKTDVSSFLPMSGVLYWSKVVKAALAMLKTMLRNWNLRSPINLVITYLLVCVVSEMPPSLTDMQSGLPGFLLLIIFFGVLNLIPPLGRLIDGATVKLQPTFFSIHVVVLFVLLIDLCIFVCFALPLSIIF